MSTALLLLRPLRALLWLTLFGTHLFLANLLLTITLPLSLLLPRKTYDLNSSIAYTVWAFIQHIFESQHHARITFSGDYTSLPPHENALVIANHLSWTDFYLLQALAQRKGMLKRCRWFAKTQLRWVPLLGWGLLAMKMPMVTRRWTSDRREMEGLFGRIRRERLPMWLIAFSESTRYTLQKWAETKAFCEARHKPVLPHVLYPRTKGFVTCVQNLRHGTYIQHVYDVTLVYGGEKGFMKPPTVWETLGWSRLSPPWRFHVHVRRFKLEELPEGDEAIAAWLEERWVEKSRVLCGMEKEWDEWRGLVKE